MNFKMVFVKIKILVTKKNLTKKLSKFYFKQLLVLVETVNCFSYRFKVKLERKLR